MFKCFILLGVLVQVLSQGEKRFRFDYEFSAQAGGWLKFHIIPATWREARLRCDAEGAVLASPLNERLKSALIALVNSHKGPAATTIFTGVHASFSKGDYSSMEGVPLLRLSINWAPGEPDNFDNAESCLAMFTDSKGSISDVRCGDVLPYICYKEDTHLTMTECGTTDPEYILEPRTGSCYKLSKTYLVWYQAYMTCAAEGGHLLTIDSEQEKAIVSEYFKKTSRAICIGFQDWGERTYFMTIHGKPAENNFIPWADNEPNNATHARTLDAGEFCGCVDVNSLLNDYPCGVPQPFLCEKKPNSLL